MIPPKLIVYATLGLAAIVALGLIVNSIRESGAAAERQQQAEAAAVAEKERVKDDAKLENLSDRALCERALRAQRMRIDACASL